VKNSDRLPEKTSRKQRPLQRKNVRSPTCPKRRAPLSAKRERKRQSASASNDYYVTLSNHAMQTDALPASGYRACLLSRAADRSALGCKYVMPSEREKMLAGDLYNPLDPELVRARERARDLCQHARGSAGGVRVDLDRASWFGRRHRVDAAAVLLRLRYKHTSWERAFSSTSTASYSTCAR
jgi:Maltose acetyltransferase hexapeptide capping motif